MLVLVIFQTMPSLNPGTKYSPNVSCGPPACRVYVRFPAYYEMTGTEGSPLSSINCDRPSLI